MEAFKRLFFLKGLFISFFDLNIRKKASIMNQRYLSVVTMIQNSLKIIKISIN